MNPICQHTQIRSTVPSSRRRGTTLLALALACSAGLSGCDVMYLSRHDIGRQQCDKLVDFEARKACLAKLPPADYGAYEKQREKLSEGNSEKALPPAKPKAGCFKREATGETVCAN